MNKYLARPFHLYRRTGYFQSYLAGCAASGAAPKLHVGCGDRPAAGWCNIDVAHIQGDVQYVDALKRLPFADETFQYVFSEHFIEHLSFDDGMKFFKEAHRALKRGGILRTATPDLNFLMELNSASDSGNAEKYRRYIDYVSRNFAPRQPASPVTCANATFYGWGHRFIWNAAFMSEALKPLGFGDFRAYKPGQSDLPELRGIEQHGKSVPPEINEWETFVLEATKQ
jgi:SAM-dependent methyltransferase